MERSEQKILLIFFSLIILISLFQTLWIFKNSVFVHEDTPFTGLTENPHTMLFAIYKDLFLYSEGDYTGYMRDGLGSIYSLALYSSSIIPEYLIGGVYANELYDFIEGALAGISLFLLLYYISTNLSQFKKAAVAFSGFMIASSFIPQEPLYILSLSLSLFFILRIFKSESKNQFWLNFSLLALSISLMIGFGGITYLIQNFAFLVLIGILLSIISERQLRLRFATAIFGALVIALLINSSMASEVYLLSIHNYVSHDYYSFSKLAQNYAFGFPNILSSLMDFPSNSGPYYIIPNAAIFVIALIGIFLISERRWDLNKKLYAALLLTLFLLVILHNRIGTPFGSLFDFAVSHVHQLYAIRYGFGNWAPIQSFIMALLVVLSIGFAVANPKMKYVAFALIPIVVVLSIPAAFYNYFLPYTHSYYYVSIPGHVYNVSDHINSVSGDYNVATLPSDPGYQNLDSWYTGTDIYSYLIDKPVFTGGYISETEIFYPPSESLYSDFGSQIGNLNITNSDYISHIFGVLGIRYIIVQGDAVHSSTADPGYYNPFSYNTIYANLNSSNGIKFVKRYGNTSIYLNNLYVPLVYSSNLYILPSNDLNQTFSAISNSSFEIQNYSVYDPASFDGYSPIGKMVAYEVRPFSKPNVSFDYANPTYAVVHVSNATTPFYLVFRESYDPSWSAYFSNGTEISPSDHLLVNGFANAWYIDAKGSYTIHIYYTLQTYADIAWVVSFAALFATLGIGVYGWKESKMAKARVKKRK